MNNISLILIAKDESANIKKWNKWIHKLKMVDELILVDDYSSDDTIDTTKKLSKKSLAVNVFQHNLNQDFSSQRQFAVDQAKNDWILWLDADENPSDELIEYINNIDDYRYNFAFKRADVFLGSTLQHGETTSQYFLRLFHRRHGYFSGMVHELWVSSMPTVEVDKKIVHHSHDTLKTFFEKINNYSDIRAQELYKAETKVNLFEIITYPTAKFFHNYFLRLGFLDKTPGIIVALGMSFHSFLVRSKLWTLYNS